MRPIPLLIATIAMTCGCQVNQVVDRSSDHGRPIATLNQVNKTPTEISTPKPAPAVVRHSGAPPQTQSMLAEYFWQPPLTSGDVLPSDLVALSLDDILNLALNDARILRSLGGRVLDNPNGSKGAFDPAIVATDAVIGVEAALAQFDANLSASLNHANNDNVFNNSILGGGATEIVQDLTTANVGLQKTGVTGTQYSLRKNVVYDSNDNLTSIFPSSYTGFWEATARHPLLQGAGMDFNRIAGPNSQPGFRNTNGVLISQIDHDASIAKFEQDVREYVNEVVTAYWELYFAYQNFDASRSARDAAQETWQTVKARFDNDLPGGEADKEAQAREQYFQFQQRLVTSLNGDPRGGVTGILQAEANLRRLLGLPQSDGRLICPADKPASVKSVFDWYSIVNLALDTRVELKQQAWQVKKREMELLASKNFLMPRLDAVATFRNNGFGDDLTGGTGRFSSVYDDMTSGDHNEWEMGLQFNMPIGFRTAHAGVRNFEMKLLRERALLEEQEKQIIHDLGTAFRQVEQYYAAMQYAFNRLQASRDMRDSRIAAFEADTVSLDLLLEAQRRLADSENDFHRAQVNFQLANESIDRESGQLLASHAIHLSATESCFENCEPKRRLSRRRSNSMDYRY